MRSLLLPRILLRPPHIPPARLRPISTTAPRVFIHRGSLLRHSFSALPRRSISSGEHAVPAVLPSTPLPVLTPPSAARWLLLSSTLVFAVIVVGGVTRLTESGLSITEWKPVTGILPPLSDADWLLEFDKYKATPEFKILNSNITLSDFKSIFYMEWSHRVLGRVIGLVFVAPLAYFSLRRKISPSTTARLSGLALLIGAQGVLGWYMVQSGLEETLLDTPNAVPRVSQYRLAAHLGAALALYAGMFGSGMCAVKEWKFSRGAAWSGISGGSVARTLANRHVVRFRRVARGVTLLVFLTALSGAFVAGLDAGLLYNEFPFMGARLAPPINELFDPAYAKSADKFDAWWRNLFENPTTVQFDHRLMATTTYVCTLALFIAARRIPALPPLTRTATTVAFTLVNLQAALGISTLLYLVPVPLAAAHQAGSVALLSAMIHLLITLRRPGYAARAWRAVYRNKISARAVSQNCPDAGAGNMARGQRQGRGQ